jgi:hypothetical protein
VRIATNDGVSNLFNGLWRENAAFLGGAKCR